MKYLEEDTVLTYYVVYLLNSTVGQIGIVEVTIYCLNVAAREVVVYSVLVL